MKTLKYIAALFFTVVLVSALGCASSAKHEGTGEFVDDTVITTKVKAAIFKGVVQLSGFVHDAGDKRKAAEIAQGVKGVKSVKDDVRLK